MYVCLCRGITDSALRDAAGRQPDTDARRICRDLGVAQECGRCARAALAIVHAAQHEAAASYRAVAAAGNVVRMFPLAS
ncbi:MAG: (2Fe-2S)-binding protein [Pseudomonadota bacterium]